MMKWVILMVVLNSCIKIREKHQECADEDNSITSLIFRPVNIYESPRSGYSCEEYDNRAYYPELPNYGCDRTMANSTQYTENSSSLSSAQNTVVAGVLEARRLVYNDKFSFYATEDKIEIRSLNSPNEELRVVTTGSINAELLLLEDLLIVYADKAIKFYQLDHDKLDLLTEVETYPNSMLRIRDNTLFVSANNITLSDDVKCSDIIYYDDSRGQTLFGSFEINLETKGFKTYNQKLLYGFFNTHLDLDGKYLFKNYYNKSKSILIKSDDGNDLFSTQLDGTIPGRFSLREVANKLVTFVETNSWTNLVILSSELEIDSEITHIAHGEKIYSTRFTNNSAYLITYKEVDPLFTFDLSDITNPKLLGELKIPGFSRYLHTMGNDLLLGIGEQEQGHIELSLFDISDMKLPSRVATFEIKDLFNPDFFYDHQLITVLNKTVILTSSEKVYIFIIEDQRIQELGVINTELSLATEVMVYQNTLYLFTSKGLRTFLLQEGVPELI